eukprot:m.227347 g.227347  ORF g.227347 m.227347 type:complete len:558 (+) comp10849_c1_seq14:4415-6088(+)
MSDNEDWEGWEAEGGELQPCRDLFSEAMLDSAQAALDSARDNNGCDLLKLKADLGLDFYGCMRLVNFLRATYGEPGAPSYTTPSADDFAGDEFLRPVIPDDPLLSYDWEPEEWSSDDDDDGDSNGAAADADAESNAQAQARATSIDFTALGFAPDADPEFRAQACAAKYLETFKELQQMREAFGVYRETAERALLGGSTASELTGDAPASAARRRANSGSDSDSDDEEEGKRKLDGYFSSYSHFGIHEEMLKDRVRTESYRDFMYKNEALFKDKVVLDVGCGTGILSMFAAKAGAKHVIGVDNSDIIVHTRAIIKENGFEDKITLIRGKVEEIELPVKQIDIIVSEWMGYFLLFESMLDTVLFARDKWLAPGGVVHPDKASLYLVGLSDEAMHRDRVDYWDDVYGFKMPSIRNPVLEEASVFVVENATAMTNPFVLKDTDIMSVTVKELEFTAPFQLVASRAATLTAFCSYFDILFEAGCDDPVYFSTGPEATPTHWKQTVFLLRKPIVCSKGDIISGTLRVSRCADDERSLEAEFVFELQSLNGENGAKQTQSFRV